MSALWSDHFLEMSASERLRCGSFFKKSFGANQTVRLIKVSALEDARFREVPLYLVSCFEPAITSVIVSLFSEKFYILKIEWNAFLTFICS